MFLSIVVFSILGFLEIFMMMPNQMLTLPTVQEEEDATLLVYCTSKHFVKSTLALIIKIKILLFFRFIYNY